MKKTGKLLKAFFAVFLASAVGISASAAESTVFEANFSAMEEMSLPQDYIKETHSSFSAGIKAGALEVKSDSLCYWRAESAENINGAENAHGITLQYQNGRFIKKLENPIVFGGVTYEYSGKGNSSVFIGRNGERNAVKQFTYINEDKYKDETTSAYDALRTNATRFVVDTSRFKATDNRVEVEVVYYTEDVEGNKCEVWYPKKGGGSAWVSLYDEAKLSADGTGEWRSAKAEIYDADFTSKIDEGNNIKNSLRIESAPSKVNWFYSISVYKPDDGGASADENIIEKKLSYEPLYGNVKLSYDLTFPKGELCIEGCEYNGGENKMAVSLADGGAELAEVSYELSESSAKIYALSSSGGRELVFEDDVLNRKLNFEIETNMKEKTYSVKVSEDGALIGGAENISCANEPEGGGYMRVQYLRLKQSSASKALFSKTENVCVKVEEDVNYRNCSDDAEALKLEIPGDNIVTGDFALPQRGSKHSSVISWRSSDESAVKISSDGGRAEVIRSENAADVVLTAEIVFEDYKIEKEFYITVKSLLGAYMKTEEPKITYSSDGKAEAEITVYNPGTAGAKKITFAVFATDGQTGDIRDRKTDIRDNIPKYGALKFSVSGLDAKSGDKILCCLWDENNVPIANSAPTKITGLKAENKVKSVNLSWDKSYDDYDAVDYYEVYRDGELIAKCSDLSYKDSGAEYLENHEYTVLAVDTNEFKGEGAKQNGCTVKMPYWLIPEGKTEAKINSNGNGISIAYRDNPARAAYTEYAEVTDAKGETTVCRFIPDNRYIGFYTDKSKINSKSVAVEITYLDTEGELIFQYNSVIPAGKSDGAEYALKEIKCGTMTNTREWKTLSIKLEDAQFRESLLMSGADFCLLTKSGSGYYVRKVELIEGELYD